MIELCPVCDSPATREFLRRQQVPVHQNLVLRDRTSAIDLQRGDLAMRVCENCGFVFNAAFDLSRLSYGAAYDNNQACSPSFNDYLGDLTAYLVNERGVRDCRIVEVGCGDGSFLRRLIEWPGGSNRGIGFDPAYAGPETDGEGRLRFERRYYGPECADIPADVVVCRHVIEHVPDPVPLLRTVRAALARSPHARVFFETPDVTWILRGQVMWDFFYEHCSLFTPDSLSTAFERAGFVVEDVRIVFGGQYQWLEARVGDEPTVRRTPGQIPALARAFGEAEARRRADWDTRLRALNAGGKVALWGAGAKGVTFANLADPEAAWLDCVVDLNPNKQGGFLPGTGHPIVSYADLGARGVRRAIVMNPNYLAENRTLLRNAGLDLDLVEWQENGGAA